MKVALIAALSAVLVAVGAATLPNAIGQQDASSPKVSLSAAKTTASDDSAVRRERHRAREREQERKRERAHARKARANDEAVNHDANDDRVVGEPGDDRAAAAAAAVAQAEAAARAEARAAAGATTSP